MITAPNSTAMLN